MRPSSPKTLFALVITAIGLSLLCVSSQEVHGSSCPTQDCESCAFCALATPACVTPCPQGCPRREDQSDELEMGLGTDENTEVTGVASGDSLKNQELTCPIAVDLLNSSPAAE